MKVGIDASRYKFATATGVEWYSYHIINHLMPRLGRDHNSEITLFLKEDTEFEEDFPFNVKKKVIPFGKFWTQLRLSYEMVVNRQDVLFVPSHVQPLIIPKKLIITIHDLAFKDPKLKNIYSFKERFLLNWSTKRAVKKANKIIVPSQATKDDLIKYYNCKKKKIVVIPHGAPELKGENNPVLKKWTKKEKNEILKRVGLKDGELFVLYVGRLETKKNLASLVEAFSRFRQEYPDWKLVLAGKKGIGFEDIISKIAKYNLEKEVIMPGYISEKEKSFLLDKCRIFAFPSLYEGFGLPILEAFAYRKPVLTSKITAMPEIAGEAAFLVDPENIAEISVGLKRMAFDGMLVSKLIEAGDLQLNKFDWENSAEQTFNTIFY
ncbi:glycosyltransferase [Candidatus Peregrinibacteria bacterium]|nr:glycosyltransferase [Candidatus Peregrinibacteria bacterium]